MSQHPEMSAFGAEIYALGCAITRCRDLDRAVTDFTRAWAEDQERLPEPVIAPAKPF
jgi:hypothetical protein